jgi:thiol-disulfide isomerase/thioredoxin
MDRLADGQRSDRIASAGRLPHGRGSLMRRRIVGVVALLLWAPSSFAQGQADVRLDLVTYKQLGSEIRKLEGQVVLVDFWADYCQPCKQKFPHVQALQRKYAKEGLAVVAVSVDDVEDPDARERAKAFLRQQRSSCRNLLLAEKPEMWVSKLKMNSIPSMFLFDRHGRLINRWTGDEVDLSIIERRIVELLKAEAN